MTNLLKKLTFCENGVNINFNTWNIVCLLQKSILNGENSVISSKWLDNYNFYNDGLCKKEIDLSIIDTWSTYSECINLNFKYDNEKICCVAVVQDDNDVEYFDGRRANKRFSAEILISETFLKSIEFYINNKFESFLSYSYDDYLESVKNKWMADFASGLLKK